MQRSNVSLLWDALTYAGHIWMLYVGAFHKIHICKKCLYKSTDLHYVRVTCHKPSVQKIYKRVYLIIMTVCMSALLNVSSNKVLNQIKSIISIN
jgi:hypothetical protein